MHHLLLPLLLAAAPLDPSPPASTVKLVFVHHSTGENWMADGDGALALALASANWFVSDTYYGWGPPDADAGGGTIGDHTDIGNFYSWFAGPHASTYLNALYNEFGRNSGDYTRLSTAPAGENTVVMFKSCFPNAALSGSPSDPIPAIGANPLRHQDASSPSHTLANVKGIYQALLPYFASRPDKLFVLIVNPPLERNATSPTEAANMRALADWLLKDWLASYPLHNVFAFDFYNVLTSDGGSTRTNDPNANDLGWSDGNHHRLRNGAVERTATVANDVSAYPTSDSHPSAAGNLKATAEFVPLLNVAYHCWKGTGGCPSATAACSLSCTATVPSSGTAGSAVAFSATATPSGCASSPAYDWDFGDLSPHGSSASASHAYSAPGTYTWRLTATADGQTCTKSGTVTIASAGTTCTADAQHLCLQGSRFRVEASYRDYAGNTGAAQAVALTSDTGYFWFFSQQNVEVVVKLLDFCGVNSRWAVYAAGLTDVEIVLKLTDTRTGSAKTYTNGLGVPFVLVRDAPFACP